MEIVGYIVVVAIFVFIGKKLYDKYKTPKEDAKPSKGKVREHPYK